MVHIKTTERNLAQFYVISFSYLASILGAWKICMHLHNRQLMGCINKEFCCFFYPWLVRTRQLSKIVKKRLHRCYITNVIE